MPDCSVSKVSGWIASALVGSGWTAAQVIEGIALGHFHLFLHDEGCMVGEFITSPRHKVMHIFAAGGSLKAMAELGPTIEAFGRLNGCDYSAATGRRGWVRYARRFGYRRADPAIEKEL